MWRLRFGGGFGPVARQNTERMNELITKCASVSAGVICRETSTVRSAVRV